MTQFPKVSSAGSAEPAPAPLTLADLMEAVNALSRMTLHVDSGSNVPEDRPSVTPQNSPAPPEDSLPCPECAARGCLPPPDHLSDTSSSRWYVVTRGKSVGVYSEWSEVSDYVSHVSGAVFVKCNSRAEAEAKYADALAKNKVRVIR